MVQILSRSRWWCSHVPATKMSVKVRAGRPAAQKSSSSRRSQAWQTSLSRLLSTSRARVSQGTTCRQTALRVCLTSPKKIKRGSPATRTCWRTNSNSAPTAILTEWFKESVLNGTILNWSKERGARGPFWWSHTSRSLLMFKSLNLRTKHRRRS